MDGFQRIVDRRNAGMKYWRVVEGGWEWSSEEEALEAAGLCPMKEYIRRRQTTISYYIDNCPIYELLNLVDRMKFCIRFMSVNHKE